MWGSVTTWFSITLPHIRSHWGLQRVLSWEETLRPTTAEQKCCVPLRLWPYYCQINLSYFQDLSSNWWQVDSHDFTAASLRGVPWCVVSLEPQLIQTRFVHREDPYRGNLEVSALLREDGKQSGFTKVL